MNRMAGVRVQRYSNLRPIQETKADGEETPARRSAAKLSSDGGWQYNNYVDIRTLRVGSTYCLNAERSPTEKRARCNKEHPRFGMLSEHETTIRKPGRRREQPSL